MRCYCARNGQDAVSSRLQPPWPTACLLLLPLLLLRLLPTGLPPKNVSGQTVVRTLNCGSLQPGRGWSELGVGSGSNLCIGFVPDWDLDLFSPRLASLRRLSVSVRAMCLLQLLLLRLVLLQATSAALVPRLLLQDATPRAWSRLTSCCVALSIRTAH